MSWASKAIKRHTQEKQMEQASLQALCQFCFLGCEYLEKKHRCKKVGLAKFLIFVTEKLKNIGEVDEDYFIKANQHYKDEYGLDVLEFMNMEIERNGRN